MEIVGNRILLTDEDAKGICGIGQGANCCIWLCVGADGFECLYFNRPAVLAQRFRDGQTAAKRDGCGAARFTTFLGSHEGGLVE